MDSWRCRELVLSNNNISQVRLRLRTLPPRPESNPDPFHSQLPPVLGHMPHDVRLNVEGNVFRIPRREVYVDGGSKGLLEYLLDRC